MIKISKKVIIVAGVITVIIIILISSYFYFNRKFSPESNDQKVEVPQHI